MNSEFIQQFTKLQQLIYSKEICKIPQISIKEVNSPGVYAHFKSEDLYNEKYILYLSNKLTYKPEEFIQQILFHEFTHVVDSIKFKKYNLEKFESLMEIYSEINASRIQMNKILQTENNEPFSLDQEIKYENILTLQSFMDQTYNHVVEEFTIPSTLFDENNLKMNQKQLYYYIGYVKSLKDNNIQYNMPLCNIEIFGDQFQRLHDYILNENVDIDILYLYEKELAHLIKSTIRQHNVSMIGNAIRKSFSN